MTHSAGDRRPTSLSLLAALLAGCTASAPPSPTPPATAAVAVPASGAAPPVSSATPVASKQDEAEPLLLVTDPEVVAELERKGLALPDLLGARGSGPIENYRLWNNTRYRSIAETLSADVAGVGARDAQAGVGVHRYPHRLFDVRWLRSGDARFVLVAAVNRLDRLPFGENTCGETRLVYRLAYSTTVHDVPVGSRLPATIGLEIPVAKPAAGCAEIAGRWVPPKSLKGAALAAWLAGPDGPLETSKLDASLGAAQLVVNVQQVRWPAAVRPDLGGHAEYLLRAFRLDPSGARYEPAVLENTPDATRFTSDPKLRKDFLAWLSDRANLVSVDQGTPTLPERFLAKRAVSVTPRGLARKTNRPFSAIFAASELAKLDFAGLRFARSAEGLLRRLDELTCPGCHESRSIAGFHLLGDDAAATPAANALTSGTSPHLANDLVRRRKLVGAVLGRSAALDFSQPYPERGSYAGYGAHCALGADPTFTDWKCAAGLTCMPYDSPAGDGVGQCLPSEPRAAGDPCEAGPLDGKRDRVASVARKACAANAVCNTNAVGFPGGMCTETCAALSPSAACGSIAILEPFNACVARGEPFLDCLANNVRPAGFRACGADNPCRDDYICVRAPAQQPNQQSVGPGPHRLTKQTGACIPPYFLFQMRVDGHP